jgi:hypothetical protein
MKTKYSPARGLVILGYGSSAVVRYLLGQDVLISTFWIEVIVVKKVLTRKKKCPSSEAGGGPVWRTKAEGTSGKTLPAPPGRTKDEEDDDMLVLN